MKKSCKRKIKTNKQTPNIRIFEDIANRQGEKNLNTREDITFTKQDAA